MQYDQENISKSETIIKFQENRLEYLQNSFKLGQSPVRVGRSNLNPNLGPTWAPFSEALGNYFPAKLPVRAHFWKADHLNLTSDEFPQIKFGTRVM